MLELRNFSYYTSFLLCYFCCAFYFKFHRTLLSLFCNKSIKSTFTHLNQFLFLFLIIPFYISLFTLELFFFYYKNSPQSIFQFRFSGDSLLGFICLMMSLVKVKVSQLCPTLVNPWTVACKVRLSMGLSSTRILEWVAFPFSRESSQPRDRTQVSHIAGGFFTI